MGCCPGVGRGRPCRVRLVGSRVHRERNRWAGPASGISVVGPCPTGSSRAENRATEDRGQRTGPSGPPFSCPLSIVLCPSPSLRHLLHVRRAEGPEELSDLGHVELRVTGLNA